jgi:predicted anti-sigma-YlaC factor YlaD
MDCEAAGEVLSAALDDEAGLAELEAARRHAGECGDCRIGMEALLRANRLLRFREATTSDLTSSILEEWDRAHPGRRLPSRLVRAGLALVGVTNILLAAWFLSDAHPSFLEPVGEHPARELAAFSATLATAFLLSAIDGRVRGRLGIVGIGVSLLVVTAVADVGSSQTHLLYEVANHLPSVIGLALLYLLSRMEPPGGSPEPAVRHEKQPGMEAAA